VGAILRQLLPAALLGLLFATVGVLHVMARVLVVHAGYRLSQLESDGRDLARENDRMKLELATLRSPARLEKIAREQLGLAPPAAGAVLTVRRRIEEPQPSVAERSTTAVRIADRGTP
jgi:cell division protein FtsL